jgi:uncharacterized membrane protein YgcG
LAQILSNLLILPKSNTDYPKGWNMNVIYTWVFGIAFALTASVAQAQAVHGVLRVVKGDVQIKSGKTGQSARARMGEKVFPKDTVITGKDARAKIVMVDNNEINVSPDSQIEIQNYEYDPAAGKKDVLLNVIYGKVRSKVEQKYDGKTSKFQIKTPSAVAGVRGTDFLTGYQGGMTNIVTFEGRVELGIPGPNGAITNPVFVSAGNQASVASGSNPTPPSAVPKTELAKMDGESKAEGPKTTGNAPANDSRQPAQQEEKKEENKDSGNKGAANDPGNKQEPGGDKNTNSGGGDKSAVGAGGSGGGSGGGSSSGDKTASNGSGSSSGGRAPANNMGGSPGGGTTAPAGGSCTMCEAGPSAPMLPPVVGLPGPGPNMLPPLPTINAPPVCTACIDIPQSGSTKLIINVNSN